MSCLSRWVAFVVLRPTKKKTHLGKRGEGFCFLVGQPQITKLDKNNTIMQSSNSRKRQKEKGLSTWTFFYYYFWCNADVLIVSWLSSCRFRIIGSICRTCFNRKKTIDHIRRTRHNQLTLECDHIVIINLIWWQAFDG